MGGIRTALAILALHDSETQWREVVSAAGGYHHVRRFSELNNDLRIDGFKQYAPSARDQKRQHIAEVR